MPVRMHYSLVKAAQQGIRVALRQMVLRQVALRLHRLVEDLDPAILADTLIMPAVGLKYVVVVFQC